MSEYSKTDNLYILFGMGPAGLFLARQLKRAGFIVYGIGKDDDIGRYSNCIKQYYATEDIVKIKKVVNDILSGKGNVKAFICSDQYLTIFLEEWIEIFLILNFETPSYELFRLVGNKKALVRYCSDLGMPFPNECRIDKNTCIDEQIDFPVAIKPKIKRGVSPIAKITVVNSLEDLIQFLNSANKMGLATDDLVIQQYIPGDNRYEYGYGGFFRNGVAVVDVVFLQLRQYPQGVSCYTYEITNEKEIASIKQIAAPFLTATQYSGFLQFDIKKHENTGKFYVLDINPRPWGSVSMLEPKCHNSSLFCNGFVPEDVKVRWRFPFKEAFSFRNRKNVPYCDVSNVVDSNCDRRTVIDLYDSKDKRPFLMQVPIAVKKIVKKIKTKCFCNSANRELMC